MNCPGLSKNYHHGLAVMAPFPRPGNGSRVTDAAVSIQIFTIPIKLGKNHFTVFMLHEQFPLGRFASAFSPDAIISNP